MSRRRPLSRRTLLGVSGALLAILALNRGAAAESQPVVIELFTSQGCSSCPPANANLIALKDRPGILALSYGVTYWDRLGWKDTFGRPEFTQRQRVYEGPLGEPGPFTPQVVVDGRRSLVGDQLAEVEAAVGASERKMTPEIRLDGEAVSIGAGQPPAGGADVWLVGYDPGIVQVPVRRGENTGRTLPHGNVVRRLVKLGSWTGQATRMAVPSEDGGKVAILVQARDGGPILAAATR